MVIATVSMYTTAANTVTTDDIKIDNLDPDLSISLPITHDDMTTIRYPKNTCT